MENHKKKQQYRAFTKLLSFLLSLILFFSLHTHFVIAKSVHSSNQRPITTSTTDANKLRYKKSQATPQELQYPHPPQFIAHRARISKQYSGNTLEAIQESPAADVKSIEINIRLSKDNVLFLYHDETLEESTNGTGKPEKQTWSMLKKLLYKTGAQESLPSLEEVFSLVGSRQIIFLDVKTTQLCNATLVKQLTRVIYKYQLQETVIIESFNPLFLAQVKRKTKDIRIMYDFLIDNKAIGEELQKDFDKMPWLLRRPYIQKQIRRFLRPNILGPRWNVDIKVLQSLPKEGYPIICWTVDEPNIANDLVSLGINGIQTNELNLLMREAATQHKTVQ